MERAIIEGVVHLIEDGATLSELSIEQIARVAGVGKAAIYRRWPGKEALVMDVLAAMEEPVPAPGGKSIRDDLVALLEAVRRRGVTKRSSAALRVVMTEVMHHPVLSTAYEKTFIEPRREALRQVLRRGVESGELRDDLDIELLGDLFVGPMLVRAVLREWSPLEEGLSDRMVDAVLEGVRRG